MKYYMYISDSKVGMILPQISSAAKRRLLPELKFNFGVVAGALRDRTDSVYSLVDNLRLVESYIRKNEHVGAVGSCLNQGDWLAGTHPCYVVTLEDNSAAVFFIGERGSTVLALGGSSNHLIGNSEQGSINIGWSFLPNLLRALNAFNEFEGKISSIYTSLPEEPRQWQSVVDLALTKCQESAYPLVNVDFLARVLLANEEKRKTFVLASPLYVAAAG